MMYTKNRKMVKPPVETTHVVKFLKRFTFFTSESRLYSGFWGEGLERGTNSWVD